MFTCERKEILILSVISLFTAKYKTKMNIISGRDSICYLKQYSFFSEVSLTSFFLASRQGP